MICKIVPIDSDENHGTKSGISYPYEKSPCEIPKSEYHVIWWIRSEHPCIFPLKHHQIPWSYHEVIMKSPMESPMVKSLCSHGKTMGKPTLANLRRLGGGWTESLHRGAHRRCQAGTVGRDEGAMVKFPFLVSQKGMVIRPLWHGFRKPLFSGFLLW